MVKTHKQFGIRFRRWKPVFKHWKAWLRLLKQVRGNGSSCSKRLPGLKVDLETQRLALTDAGQIQQSLQRQQDRLKHVESFMGKVAADSNSTARF